jgi:hypothetical protein
MHKSIQHKALNEKNSKLNVGNFIGISGYLQFYILLYVYLKPCSVAVEEVKFYFNYGKSFKNCVTQ